MPASPGAITPEDRLRRGDDPLPAAAPVDPSPPAPDARAGLTADQARAVTHRGGPLLILG
ncbi:MAG: hypothetical protein JWR30_1494, partial [Conexibacter sp.]|nr:hypothetical protein [Conexibacter sp.]